MEFILAELLEKVLKDLKCETEPKEEVKWNGVGMRKGWHSRMVVREGNSVSIVSLVISVTRKNVT